MSKDISFSMPNMCCVCAKDKPEANSLLSNKFRTEDGSRIHIRTISLKLPLCKSCKKAELKHKIKYYALAYVIIPITGFFIGSYFITTYEKTENKTFHWVLTIVGIILAVFAYSLMEYLIQNKVKNFGGKFLKKDATLIEFKNEYFLDAFVNLNNDITKRNEKQAEIRQ